MKNISARELKKKQESGENIKVIDIREAWEYEEKHMPGSENIPMHELPIKGPELEDLKDREVVLYCNTGPRSVTAAQILVQQGFAKVKYLEGGIEAWEEGN